jgi:hypothetical protein
MPRTRPLHTSNSASRHLPLHQMVADVSSALHCEDPGTLLRVTGDPLQVAYLPLEGRHPLDSLLGFVAPASWLAIGVHCRGRAYPVGLTPAQGDPSTEPRPVDGSFALAEPTSVVITTLVDRSGHGAGLLRDGPTVTRYDDAPEGVVGDACRRALGLPTPPPPPSTAELWLRVWLDRVVEAAAFCDELDRYHSWDEIAALHPAASSPQNPLVSTANPVSLDDPQRLAEATLSLADTWSWAGLRRDPEVLETTTPPFSRHLAAWMDDGMFARALLADLAALPLLAKSTQMLLPVPVLEDINEAILATGLRWTAQPEVVQ